MCACSVPLKRFPRTGEPTDIQLVEFTGLGRAKGFRVKSRRSILDDVELMERIRERTQGILTLLDPDRINDRRTRDIEILKVDLSETERRLKSTESDLAAHKGLLRSRDQEIRELKANIQRWKDHAASLEGNVRGLENELDIQKRERQAEDSVLEPSNARLRQLASKVNHLLEALDPLFDKAEYIAMDDPSFREEYEAAEEARAELRRAAKLTADEKGSEDWW